MAALFLAAAGGCRPAPANRPAPADRDVAGPEVQPVPAVQEPAEFQTPAYRLVKTPVSNTEFHGKPYAPAFVIDHYAFADPGRQLATVIQFVWQWPGGNDILDDGEVMGALLSTKVIVQLIDRCEQPTVSLRVRPEDGCEDDYWLSNRRQFRCILGATINCCPDELPMWTTWIPRGDSWGRQLPF